MVTVTYPSTAAIDMMTSLLAGLAGASCQIQNEGGNDMLSSPFILSSSPGFLLNNGTIVINGSTAALTIGSGNAGTLSLMSIGGIQGLLVTNGAILSSTGGASALIAGSSSGSVYFMGAIIPSPIGGPLNGVGR